MKLIYDAEIRNYRIIEAGEHKMIVGQIYNDTKGRFDDGATVRTSIIEEMGDGWAKTRNSRYSLV